MYIVIKLSILYVLSLFVVIATGQEEKEISLDQIRELILHQSRYITSLEHDIGLYREEIKRLKSLSRTDQPIDESGWDPFETPTERARSEYFRYTCEKGEENETIDSSDAWMYPQYISISCSTEVNVVMRPLSIHDRPNGECLDLNISGGDIHSRFVLYCNESHDGDNEEDYGNDEK